MQGPGDSPDVLQRYQSAVDQVAGQIRRSIGGSVDHDHLLGSGCEGLFVAARKYDARRGIPFRSYAGLRVRGVTLDNVRQQSYLAPSGPRAIRRP